MSYRRQRANANRHTERGLAALDQSVKADGWIGAVTVAADGETFDGSARLEVGPGFDDPIVIESDGSRPVILVRSDIPSADDPRAVRLGLAANRVAQLNLEWDPDVLSGIGAEMDLSSLWDDDELAALMPDPAPGDGGDEFDTTPDDGPTRVQAGELWQLGRHRLLCGDSTKADHVARLMQDEIAAAVVTDPPYGTGINAQDGLGNSKIPMHLQGDHNPDLARRAFGVWQGRSKLHVWWGGNYYADALPVSSCWLVWDKDHHGMTYADAELAWVSTPGPVRVFRHAWSGMHRDSERDVDRDHPTQKPVALFEWVLKERTERAALIADPFLGSGTTLIACERTGRRCYGIEIEPRYCDVILKRFTAETGIEPELIEQPAMTLGRLA